MKKLGLALLSAVILGFCFLAWSELALAQPELAKSEFAKMDSVSDKELLEMLSPATMRLMSLEQASVFVVGLQRMMSQLALHETRLSDKYSLSEINTPSLFNLFSSVAEAQQRNLCLALGHLIDTSQPCPPADQAYKLLQPSRLCSSSDAPANNARVCDPLLYGQVGTHQPICGVSESDCKAKSRSADDIAAYWKKLARTDDGSGAIAIMAYKIGRLCKNDKKEWSPTPSCQIIHNQLAYIHAAYKGLKAPPTVDTAALAVSPLPTNIVLSKPTPPELDVSPPANISFNDPNLAPPVAVQAPVVVAPNPQAEPEDKPKALGAPPAIESKALEDAIKPLGSEDCDPYRLGENVTLTSESERKESDALLKFEEIQALTCGHMSEPFDVLDRAHKLLQAQLKKIERKRDASARYDRWWLGIVDQNLNACTKQAAAMSKQPNWRRIIDSYPHTVIHSDGPLYSFDGFDSKLNRSVGVHTSRETLMNTMKLYNVSICSASLSPQSSAGYRGVKGTGSAQ
jgi:hypothetical protein